MNLFELFVTIKAVDQASAPVKALTTKMKKDLPDAAGAGSKSVIGSTSAIVTAVSTAVAAIGALVKSSIEEFAKYEQLVGGVDTLFKDSAGKIKNYADQAYLTAGMSANEYMETITSFSASLLQSLEGDTDKAAEISNQAIVDMSDNVNKMGTDMAMVRNAYQGFARQNFMMLDNLRLGYAGTKTEMQRLIDDANKIKQANGEMANLSIDSFADMVEAIHVIQTEMGITGTTAIEASTTVQGSISSMNAAWNNLIAGIGNGNKDVGKLMDDFFDAFNTALNNIEPVLERFFERLPEIIAKALPILIRSGREIVAAILVGIVKSIPELVKSFFENFVGNITSPTSLSEGEKAGGRIGKSILDGIVKLFTSKSLFVKMLDSIFGGIFGTNDEASKKAYSTGYDSGVSYSKGFVDGNSMSQNDVSLSNNITHSDASNYQYEEESESKEPIMVKWVKKIRDLFDDDDIEYTSGFGRGFKNQKPQLLETNSDLKEEYGKDNKSGNNLPEYIFQSTKNIDTTETKTREKEEYKVHESNVTNNYTINISTTTGDAEEMAKIIRREIESIDIRRMNAYGMA